MRLSSKWINLMKNIGFMTIGNFASKIMNFILIPIYTAKLTTEEYGSADLIFTTLSLLIPILTLEINEAVLRFSLSATKEKNRSIFTIGVSFSLISFVVFMVLFPVGMFFESFRQYWVYIILLYVSNLAYICMSQFAKGNKNVIEYSICGFINTVLVALFNILFLVVFKYKVEGYLLSYILGYFGATLYLIIALRKSIVFVSIKDVEHSEIKDMLKYSIPLIPNAVCWWINNASNKYILAIFCSTATVGLFSIAYKIPSLLSVVSTIFFSAWQISAVEDFGKQECQDFYSKVYRVFFVLNAMICIVLIASSELVAKFLYANDFFVAWKYSIILICAYFINSLATFMGTIYTTSKKTKMLLLSSLLAAVVNITLSFILIPLFEVYGAALATLLSYFVVLIVRVYDTKKILPIKFNILECVFLMSMMIVTVLSMFIEEGIGVWGIIACILTIIYASYIGYDYIRQMKKTRK